MFRVAAIVVAVLLVPLHGGAAAERLFDIVLQGGTVVDGSGTPAYTADIGVRDGRIARIGRISKEEAWRSIDATGLLVTPGIVETSAGRPEELLRRPAASVPFASRGTTTVLFVNPRSPAPLPSREVPGERWQTFAEYAQILELRGFAVNVVLTAGQEPLRTLATGDAAQAAEGEHLASMARAARESIAAGAAGICLLPDDRQSAGEMEVLQQVVAELGGRLIRPGDSPPPPGGSLETVVAHLTAGEANRAMIFDRGRIAEGLAADLAVFDATKANEGAALADPGRRAEAVRHVLVNGVPVVSDGSPVAGRPGGVLRGPGFREQAPVLTGKPVVELSAVEQVVQSFLKRHHAPGAALAITDRGRLVYARGFGFADIAAGEPVKPDSLFRIASISKPVTAVGIVKLIEEGRLKLDDPVFRILDGYAPVPGQEDRVEPRLASITIRHLLEHRGGWDRDVSFDAMFEAVRFARTLNVPPPAGPDEVIRNMLTQPLDFDPGERYAYSNFGYCLLGRVITKLTGQPYEAWMMENVLRPAGATGMRLGFTRFAGRQPGEVKYYDTYLSPSVFADDAGRPVPSPYGGWNLEAMDAHGGWIASAVDLARFACALDPSGPSPVLREESIRLMFERPPGAAGHDEQGRPKRGFYSLGWRNDAAPSGGFHRTHNGALAGTATVLWMRPDGRNWVFLCNARSGPAVSHFGIALAPLLNAALDHVPAWPGTDQFPDFPPPAPAAGGPAGATGSPP